MTIFYIANIRLPTEKAHGLQIMKTLEAFSKSQITNHKSQTNSKFQILNSKTEIELLVPRRLNPIKADPFEYYGVGKNFKVRYLPVLDFVKLGRMGFWIESIVFSAAAFLYLLFHKIDVIYGRDEWPLWFLSFLKKNVFWEAHQGQINFAARRLLKRAAGIIVISNGLRNFYAKNGADPKKISVAPDAVDIKKFQIPPNENQGFSTGQVDSRFQIREKLGLPQNKKIVLYAGHLYLWKGVDTLLEAARISNVRGQMSDVLFVLVGGTEKDIKNYKLKYKSYQPNNVLLAGHRPHFEIPLWLKAADILVLPNSAKEEISRSFTSPLKLFEYMASSTPIIASDLPSIREIVSENDVLFFKPDDAQDLAEKIKYSFAHEDEMLSQAKSAKQKVQNYTWSKRAEEILYFISQKKTPGEKPDFLPAFFAGLGISLLALPVLKNLAVLDFIFSADKSRAYFLVALWVIFISFGAVFGIYLARLLGRRWPIILQLARYGLIGWLNTFVYAGIFNLLIWLTGIASGFTADFLVFIAFAVAVTNSFFWNKHWVFEHSDSGHAKTEYVKFFAVTGFTAFLNIFVFHLVVNTIGAPVGLDEKIWANVSILIQIPISFLGNFFGYKIFVFKKKMLS